ncbi:MAG: 3-deoxy-manno-octulosonate cytidylyltransferase [Candidatus Eiseniibacteriota bacterium]|nr:MAG: 3-deoxy-manno-octulosonate cytidylyltransferase [Candidatus Eisenbacteria bacterium]
MKVTGVIPARFGSSRFVGKALASIRGKTLIRHVYERSRSSPCLNELLVATDDSRIAQEVEGFGGKAVLTSAEHRCGTERAAEVAGRLDADIVVNIQGDVLLSDAGMIDECVSALCDRPGANSSTLAAKITDEGELGNPNVVKVVVDLDGNALLFSRSQIPNTDCSSGSRADILFLKHIGVYAFRRDFLLEFVKLVQSPLELAESLEQLRVLEHGGTMAVAVTVHSSVGVDVPSDLEKAEAFLESLEGARDRTGGRLPLRERDV